MNTPNHASDAQIHALFGDTALGRVAAIRAEYARRERNRQFREILGAVLGIVFGSVFIVAAVAAAIVFS